MDHTSRPGRVSSCVLFAWRGRSPRRSTHPALEPLGLANHGARVIKAIRDGLRRESRAEIQERKRVPHQRRVVSAIDRVPEPEIRRVVHAALATSVPRARGASVSWSRDEDSWGWSRAGGARQVVGEARYVRGESRRHAPPALHARVRGPDEVVDQSALGHGDQASPYPGRALRERGAWGPGRGRVRDEREPRPRQRPRHLPRGERGEECPWSRSRTRRGAPSRGVGRAHEPRPRARSR